MVKPWLSGHGCIREARFGRPAKRRLLALAAALAAISSPALAASQPLPEMSSIAAEVRSEVGGKLKSFYKARNYWPLWIEKGELSPAADRLIALVESADVDGLDPDDYNPERLRRAVDEARTGSPEALAKAELRLSSTLAEYARDLAGARPDDMHYVDEGLKPERPTEVAVLRKAGVAPSISDYVENMRWMSPFYAGLRNALLGYRTDWAELPAVAIPSGMKLRPGAKGRGVQLLRERLGLPGGNTFDKPLAQRLRAFQAAHGLKADGVVGSRTLAALNRSPRDYERTLRLNLDRARALPNTNDRYILVDAAGARLWMYEDGEVKDTMRVVVGKPDQPTPMMAGLIRYAVVNPYWNLPPDLVADRIAPHMLKGASLREMGYEALSDWTANARILDDDEIDWEAVADGRKQVRVRQLPGDSNAMGDMKFMFPNKFGVYLHDTPNKELFDGDARRFSAGCVRLEDAPRLARWLFGRNIETKSDKPEQQVMLQTPVPVYITYLTAAPEGEGIAFREDPYGRDGGGEKFASR